MKLKIKKLISILISVTIIFQLWTNIGFAYTYEDKKINISKEATEYAYAHYEGLLSVVESQIEFFDVKSEQLDSAKLGKPFVIYELENQSQDEIYYYPVIDSKENIILIISVMGTTEGWSVAISEEWVNELKPLDYTAEEYIFYKTKKGLYAENKKEHFCLVGEEYNNDSFFEKSYINKKNEINEAITKFEKKDIDNDENDYDWKCKYTPSFSSSTSSSKQCALYNSQGQGAFGLCWAASIATINNYLYGDDITAVEVADEMGIGYNVGATLYEALRTLQRFGINYQNYNDDSNNVMSWDLLRNNINAKSPVYVFASSTIDHHAVVACGYTVAAGVRYVSFWNSGENGGEGALKSAEFKDSGTAFTYGTQTFVWKKSISNY